MYIIMLMHKGTVQLTTDRLCLRQFSLSDAPDMFRNYATDERVTRFLSWTPYKSIGDVERFLSGIISEYRALNTYHWAIEYDNMIIGSISAISTDEKNLSCELGYCIGYDYWNKGLTSEAMRAVIKFLFREVGVHRIMAKHDVDNPASGKVMINCGMKYEGRLHEHYLRHDGTFSDALVYAMLEGEFDEK